MNTPKCKSQHLTALHEHKHDGQHFDEPKKTQNPPEENG